MDVMDAVFTIVATPWWAPIFAFSFGYLGPKAARLIVGLLRELRS